MRRPIATQPTPPAELRATDPERARSAGALGVAPVAELWAAVALLTRLRPPGGTAGRTGAAAFGVVGLCLGVVAALPVLVLGTKAPLLGAALGVAAASALSGGLHLDGLADTVDSLAAPTAEAAERARRDPRVGAVGAAALVLVLVVEVAALAALAADPWQAAWAVVAAATASRAVPAVAAPWLPVSEGGFGAWFGRHTGPLAGLAAGSTAVVLAVVAPGAGPKIGLLAAALIGPGALAIVARRFGFVSGDGLGASVELAFAASLIAQAAVA